MATIQHGRQKVHVEDPNLVVFGFCCESLSWILELMIDIWMTKIYIQVEDSNLMVYIWLQVSTFCSKIMAAIVSDFSIKL